MDSKKSLSRQWCLDKPEHNRANEEEEKISLITMKKDIAITEEELVTQFQYRLFKFRKHLFNSQWQYHSYRTLRENLTNNCLIHIDLSENFTSR